MSISKIQSGDNIKVISGAYKGTVGQIIKVRTIKKKKNLIKRVAVSTIPKIVKYFKSNKLAGMQGMISSRDRYINISNVALLDENNKVTKVKIIDKKRLYKSTGSAVPKNIVEKKLSLEQNTDNK